MWFFPLGFLTKTLQGFLSSPIRATYPYRLILLDFTDRILFSVRSTDPVPSYLLDTNSTPPPQLPVRKQPQLTIFARCGSTKFHTHTKQQSYNSAYFNLYFLGSTREDERFWTERWHVFSEFYLALIFVFHERSPDRQDITAQKAKTRVTQTVRKYR